MSTLDMTQFTQLTQWTQPTQPVRLPQLTELTHVSIVSTVPSVDCVNCALAVTAPLPEHATSLFAWFNIHPWNLSKHQFRQSLILVLEKGLFFSHHGCVIVPKRRLYFKPTKVDNIRDRSGKTSSGTPGVIHQLWHSRCHPPMLGSCQCMVHMASIWKTNGMDRQKFTVRKCQYVQDSYCILRNIFQQ